MGRTWTREEEQFLLAEWIKGTPAPKIAATFNDPLVTRNSIIGKAHRLLAALEKAGGLPASSDAAALKPPAEPPVAPPTIPPRSLAPSPAPAQPQPRPPVSPPQPAPQPRAMPQQRPMPVPPPASRAPSVSVAAPPTPAQPPAKTPPTTIRAVDVIVDQAPIAPVSLFDLADNACPAIVTRDGLRCGVIKQSGANWCRRHRLAYSARASNG